MELPPLHSSVLQKWSENDLVLIYYVVHSELSQLNLKKKYLQKKNTYLEGLVYIQLNRDYLQFLVGKNK